VLTIGAGQISSATSEPWYDSYRNSIRTIKITGILTLSGTGPVGLFRGLTNMSSIQGITNIRTSEATDFTDMFNGDHGLASLDLTSFDTRNTVGTGGYVDLEQGDSQYNGQANMFNDTPALGTIYAGPNTLFEDDDITQSGGVQHYTSTATAAPASFSSGAFKGTWGTATWWIDATGNIRVGGGSISTATDEPWWSCRYYVRQITFGGPLTLSGTGPVDLFRGLPYLSNFINLTYVNTSKANAFTDMFYGDESIATLDLSSFDLRNTMDSGGSADLVQGTPRWDSGQTNMFYDMPSLNTIHAGPNFINYLQDTSITQLPVGVHIVAPDYTAVAAKNSSIAKGLKWSAKDNFVSAKNSNGDSVPLSSVSVTGSVNTGKVGTYKVTYSYGGKSAVGTVTVYDKSSLALKNTTVNMGTKYSYSQSFVSATNSSGAKLAYNQVKWSGSVNMSKAGTYTVKAVDGSLSKTATVTVRSLAAVAVRNSSIAKGSKWAAANNFVSAKSPVGAGVPFSSVKVTGSVNTGKVGTYKVTYSYGGKSAVATVTVYDKSSLALRNVTIGLGTKYSYAQSFSSATNASGAKLAYDKVKWSGSVNTAKAGTYTVKAVNGSLSKSATVTVKNFSSLTVKNVSITQFDSWSNAKAFVSATNPAGAKAGAGSVKVTGSVDVRKVGSYTLTYSYSGVSRKVVVTVTPFRGTPVAVYRVYNTNSGLHHYTTSVSERDALVGMGWKSEGTSFRAAEQGSISGLMPVYREYNPYDGNHNWTLDQNEHRTLVSLGWHDEGVAWYTNPAGPVPVYRLYNPHSGEHVYTTSAKEYAAVGAAGWHQEGTAWKGL
jgi:surface protein